jgi:hypothetical protein
MQGEERLLEFAMTATSSILVGKRQRSCRQRRDVAIADQSHSSYRNKIVFCALRRDGAMSAIVEHNGILLDEAR